MSLLTSLYSQALKSSGIYCHGSCLPRYIWLISPVYVEELLQLFCAICIYLVSTLFHKLILEIEEFGSCLLLLFLYPLYIYSYPSIVHIQERLYNCCLYSICLCITLFL